ncbi:phosphocholine cytidylyltransferase family protein [Stappia indica]|uniref:phosphocholine cytidylyltransferase family protein n=1 Tax=Stappia indica TaxID=538381 RepID=UPI001CD1FA3A|nr:phosphocholine cytidylyltransferase family protein [Stappia indica]MCA1298141.1 phosphocholine cytidylyltransferase family protein [Stappia indica]
MRNITAILLAAGRGVRMGARGRMTPKGLLSLGDRSFVEESLDTLRAHDIGAIRIVTGHLEEQYREMAGKGQPGVTLAHNPDYAVKGSLHSLLVGLDGHTGPCLVLETDLIYEPRAISAAIGTADRSALLVSGPTEAGDEVYVWADERTGTLCLRDMSKTAGQWPDPHHGELVGITHLTGEAVEALKAIGAGMVAETPMADYESGLVALAREHPVTCPKIDDLAWAEVDDETMLARAAERVYPRIVAARQAATNQSAAGTPVPA